MLDAPSDVYSSQGQSAKNQRVILKENARRNNRPKSAYSVEGIQPGTRGTLKWYVKRFL